MRGPYGEFGDEEMEFPLEDGDLMSDLGLDDEGEWDDDDEDLHDEEEPA